MITFLLALQLATVHAHEGNEEMPPATLEAPSTPGHKETIARINETYVSTVKPMFKNKCFDCHSDQTRYPWYYKIPGVKWLIDHDVEEAREHMDLSLDFPFKTKSGNLLRSLEEIREVMEEASMPPRLYRLMHLETKLTPEDKRLVIEWTRASEQALKTAVSEGSAADVGAAPPSPAASNEPSRPSGSSSHD